MKAIRYDNYNQVSIKIRFGRGGAHYLWMRPRELLLDITRRWDFRAGSWFLFIEDLLCIRFRISDLFLLVPRTI